MIGLDYGVNNKLTAHGENGKIDIPRVPHKSGFNSAEKFAWKLEQLLMLDDVTTESATIGSCGCEAEHVRDLVQRTPHTLYVISTRAVKNLRKDKGLDGMPSDAESAAMIYEIATKPQAELRVWHYVAPADKRVRTNTTVRPYDKRDYQDAQVDTYMNRLPDFDSVPAWIRDMHVIGNGMYSRAVMLPFAMALTEDGATSRSGYEQIIGLYANGYPSFYRRATVDLMQVVAKQMTGKRLNGDVTPVERKDAWRITRKIIRTIYAMSK